MKTYTIELDDKQLNIVLFSLQKQSFEVVNELIQVIIKQIQIQQNDAGQSNIESTESK